MAKLKFKSNVEKGDYGESYIFMKLQDEGINIKWLSFGHARHQADFITESGTLIDVKTAMPRPCSRRKNGSFQNHWGFNFHHHGDKQLKIDVFICITLQSTGGTNIFVFPSELISGYNINISDRQLSRGKFDYFKENWDLIK